jgi:hypothetical protein
LSLRLKISANAANEQLIAIINSGYDVLRTLRADYHEKRSAGTYSPDQDNAVYRTAIAAWVHPTIAALNSIFPTQLEANQLSNPRVEHTAFHGMNADFNGLINRLSGQIQALEGIQRESVPHYTDLPIKTRLYVEDIESFGKVRDINPAAVKHMLQDGFFNQTEDDVQRKLERILHVPLHKTDWPGEVNDLYTANIVVNGARVAAAFMLKGNGLRVREMQIGHCGKNGDQLVRLLRSPAQLFVVQYVGNIAEAVIEDMEAQIQAKRAAGTPAHYCIIDGQDIARLFLAYTP